MAGRSALDRLAIAGVVIAGIVEAAQAALASAPAVRKAYPVLNLTGTWNYVPLIFICGATLLWVLDQALRIFRPSYARARAALSANDEVREPDTPRRPIPWGPIFGAGATIACAGLVVAAIMGMSRCSADNTRRNEAALAAAPQMKFPPVLRGSVTQAFVKQTLQTQDAVTAEKSLSTYLGTEMRASGTVHSNETGAQNSHLIYLTEPTAKPQVYLLFSEGQSQSGAQYYQPGQHIAASCKIERLDSSGIGLDGCALISDEAWTGKPTP
jgi:hypothetical protein